MRVIMVSPYEQERDGLADYTAALISELEAIGHAASVVLPTRGLGELCELRHLPTPPTARAMRAFIASLDRPDVLHVQFAVSAFHTQIPALLRLLEAAEINNIPVVATLHEVARDLDLLGPVGRRLYRTLERRCVRLIVHTDRARVRLIDEVGASPEQIVVLPHFQRPAPTLATDSNALRSSSAIAPDDQVVLAFGFIHVDKGLDTLIDAWLDLRVRRPELIANSRLVVAGDVRRRTGPFRAFELRDRLHLRHVLARVAEAGADRDIVFTGHVPEADVAAWFGTATVGVLPYRRIEQSGVGSLARAFGLPLAVSKVGDLPNLSSPERIFPEGDVTALADVLERCLLDPPPRGELTANDALASLAVIGGRLAQLYSSVLDDRTRVTVAEAPRPSDPALSVVVCSYNGAEGIKRCLNALLQQTGILGRFEIIVVDDGSVDRTADLASSLGVTVVRHARNRGLAAARNTGVTHAAAPVVAFVDDDCEAAPDWASALLQSWKAVDDDVAVIGGTLEPVVADTAVGRFTRRHDPLKPLELDLAASTDLAYRIKLYLKRLRSSERQVDVRRVFAVAGGNMTINRELVLRAGGFDERFRFGSEDLEMCLRLAEGQVVSPVVFDPDVRVRHHFAGTVGDTVRRARAYGRGSARLTRARDDVPPTIFPVPFLTAGVLAAAFRMPPLAVVAALLPPLIYGIVPAEPDTAMPVESRWLDPYLTLLQESAANVGFAGSWRAYRFLAASASAASRPPRESESA